MTIGEICAVAMLGVVLALWVFLKFPDFVAACGDIGEKVVENIKYTFYEAVLKWKLMFRGLKK